ncbi:protoporphyrinogen oxidase HemJ [Tistrella mobilis]|jgi:putative membrane protein|uniref:protoporphyrinogen oxidase HemJ n=1 Tax=Tistrella mobilis TaxID=171437 RepID=UPI003557468A
MIDAFAGAYPWFKALHVISVIAWMAGMFYLPRLFVYHADAAPGSELSERFKVMERRLLKAIINPAMVATWLFGILILTTGAVSLSEGWLHAKIALVLIMSGMHGAFSAWRRAFAEDRNRHSTRFYRWMNEVPTVLMIGIVILVIVKPF